MNNLRFNLEPPNQVADCAVAIAGGIPLPVSGATRTLGKRPASQNPPLLMLSSLSLPALPCNQNPFQHTFRYRRNLPGRLNLFARALVKRVAPVPTIRVSRPVKE